MKKISKILLLFVLTITLSTTINVNAATSKTVNSQAELKEALNDSNISTIILGSDIETTEKINIMRDVTIDGNNKTIKYVGKFGSSSSSDNTVWGGIYVLQIYKSNVTLKNRVVRKLKMLYNLSARYESRRLESSLYGVTLIHI